MLLQKTYVFVERTMMMTDKIYVPPIKIQGRLKRIWSTGWWVPVYSGIYIVQWLPVWRN